jgi:hypothetical protein
VRTTPTDSPSGTTDSGNDTGGSAPDEAISDAAEAPHRASTPDDPAEVVTIDEDAAKNV